MDTPNKQSVPLANKNIFVLYFVHVQIHAGLQWSWPWQWRFIDESSEGVTDVIGGITFATEAVRKAIPRLSSSLSLSLSQEMPQLRSLWLQGNSLPSAELQKILEKRPPLEVEDSTAQKTKMPHFVETWHFGRRWRHARLHCKRVHFRNDRFLSCALLRSQDQADSIVPSTLPVPDFSLLADASCFEKGQISNLGGFLFERLVSSLVEGLLSFQKLLARLEAPTALQTGARGWLCKNISIIVDHMRWALVARPVTVLAVNRECSWVFVFFLCWHTLLD